MLLNLVVNSGMFGINTKPCAVFSSSSVSSAFFRGGGGRRKDDTGIAAENIEDHEEREWTNTEEDARGSGDDKQKAMGKKVLSNCNQMEQWQLTIYSFL